MVACWVLRGFIGGVVVEVFVCMFSGLFLLMGLPGFVLV